MFFVQIAGNLGQDPETRVTPSGQKVINFSVAVKQRKGKEEITTWVKVVSWGDRHEKMISFLKKGSAVIVNGKMNAPTIYDGKNGPVISLEITAEMIEFSPFGSSKKEEGAPSVHKQDAVQDQEENLPF